MLNPQYDPKLVEDKVYETWLKSGYFNPDNLPVSKNSKLKAKNYIVYMPLPNVTGALHMGHALNNTIQDILIRYHRMKGFKTLWFPGTDHAGIATQYVVEKELRKQNISRFELGREKFIERVWEWKKKYGDAILNQLKKIGVSADWSRVRFTMDESYSRDVLSAFVHYYEKGWLYRGLRTVNWCPKDGTSLSELELEYTEEKTTLYYVKYGPFTLATTRPETKFGDTALAVNPKDGRYKKYVGQILEVDSLDTEGILEKPDLKKIRLRVVEDDAVDKKFGTGVVKVTPAHDLVDFEIGQRHQLPIIQIIDERGRTNEKTGKYAGLKTVDARKKVVEDMKMVGLLVKEESYDHRIAKCYRCGTTIEPIPSNQWFLKMDKLGALAEKSVKSGKVKIQPKNFQKTYLDWAKNIRDWNISRQIWWGHRLPVWQCKCQIDNNFKLEILNLKLHQERQDNFIVSLKKPEQKCKRCGNEYEQVSDVLDTWFSSALWPFAGLSKEDLKNYYPGNALITARDILNLWVARMIFSGLEFHKKVPFTDVFINGTILAKDGKRMSKSLGTGIDPLNYINQFGADATRFGIIWQASGQDIRWDEAAVVAGRKFANKIWNASRYVLTNISPRTNANLKRGLTRKNLTIADKKILSGLAKTKKQTEKLIEGFEFSQALHGLYEFFWHDFCDKYIEESKRQCSNEKLKVNTQKILAYALKESLKMLHPFMPFITEAVYEHFPVENKKLLIIETW